MKRMRDNIKLVRSKRKTISIEITPEAQVIVRAPYYASVSEINRLIGEKADWIHKHLQKMEELQKQRSEEPMEEL